MKKMKKIVLCFIVLSMLSLPMFFLAGCSNTDTDLQAPTNIRVEDRGSADPSERFVIAWNPVEVAEFYTVSFVGSEHLGTITTEVPFVSLNDIFRRYDPTEIMPTYSLSIVTNNQAVGRSEAAYFTYTVQARQLAAPLIRQVHGHIFASNVSTSPDLGLDPFMPLQIEVQINNGTPFLQNIGTDGRITGPFAENFTFENTPSSHTIRARALQVTHANLSFAESKWSEPFEFIINEPHLPPTNVAIINDTLSWSAPVWSFEVDFEGRSFNDTGYARSNTHGGAVFNYELNRYILSGIPDNSITRIITDMLASPYNQVAAPITTTINGETVEVIRIFVSVGDWNDENGFTPRSVSAAPLYFVV